MKIAVIGAGAIGGYLGALLDASGEEVTFVARGANLEALRTRGLKVTLEDSRQVHATHVRACGTIAEAGAQDVVLLTVKAHQVPQIATELPQLFHETTIVVTMQNGIPWWYFQRHGGEFEGTSLHAVDPDGVTTRCIDPSRIIGSVVYPAASLVAPATIHVAEGRRFTLGELDGRTTPRLEALSATLAKAGFKAPTTADIRGEIWLKVWGNLTFNPISALTHATLVDLIRYPLTKELCVEMMREAETIAHRLGVTIRVGLERRLAGAERVGAHKTSMLQDVELGKPLETDALIGAVVELGRLTSTPTPHINAVYACVSLLGEQVRRIGGVRGSAEG